MKKIKHVKSFSILLFLATLLIGCGGPQPTPIQQTGEGTFTGSHIGTQAQNPQQQVPPPPPQPNADEMYICSTSPIPAGFFIERPFVDNMRGAQFNLHCNEVNQNDMANNGCNEINIYLIERFTGRPAGTQLNIWRDERNLQLLGNASGFNMISDYRDQSLPCAGNSEDNHNMIRVRN